MKLQNLFVLWILMIHKTFSKDEEDCKGFECNTMKQCYNRDNDTHNNYLCPNNESCGFWKGNEFHNYEKRKGKCRKSGEENPPSSVYY